MKGLNKQAFKRFLFVSANEIVGTSGHPDTSPLATYLRIHTHEYIDLGTEGVIVGDTLHDLPQWAKDYVARTTRKGYYTVLYGHEALAMLENE